MSGIDHESEFELERPDPLPCGCVRYHKMCPEAAALWGEVVAAWKQRHAGGSPEEYYAVTARYLAHFENGRQPIPEPPRPRSLTAQVAAAQRVGEQGGQLVMEL